MSSMFVEAKAMRLVMMISIRWQPVLLQISALQFSASYKQSRIIDNKSERINFDICFEVIGHIFVMIYDLRAPQIFLSDSMDLSTEDVDIDHGDLLSGAATLKFSVAFDRDYGD